MSELLGEKVYQQRFTSSDAVTDTLNEFLKTEHSSFTFYAKKEYTPPQVRLGGNEADRAQNQAAAERIIAIRNHSLHLGVMSLQIASPIGAIQHKRGVELDFSPFAASAYWNIMQKFYGDEDEIDRRTPSPEVLQGLAEQALYVNLPRDELKSSAGFKVAANRLLQILRDPKESYKMQITKYGGISEVDRIQPMSRDAKHVV